MCHRQVSSLNLQVLSKVQVTVVRINSYEFFFNILISYKIVAMKHESLYDTARILV